MSAFNEFSKTIQNAVNQLAKDMELYFTELEIKVNAVDGINDNPVLLSMKFKEGKVIEEKT